MNGFLDALASDAAAPGAGAAVAVTAAMSASLLAMFARSSAGLTDRAATVSRADELRRAATEVIAADRAAYTRVLELRPRRREDPEAFRRAVAAANQPPRHLLEISLATVEASRSVLDVGNPAVRDDLVTGLILARAVGTGAIELIAANTRIGELPDDELREAGHLRARIQELVDEVVDAG